VEKIIIIIINRLETELEKVHNVAAAAVEIFFSWLLDSLGDVLLLLCPLDTLGCLQPKTVPELHG
jgi:hypothetical protein